MAFGNNSTSFDALLKELYSDDKVVNTIMQKNKFLGLVPKNEKAYGRRYIHPLVTGAGQGRTATFTTAKTMAGLTGEISHDFIVSLQENHADAKVASKIIAQSSSDKGSFLKAVSLIADDQLKNFSNDLAVSLYRTSDGNRGQIGSISTSYITLKNRKDVLNFSVGMQLDVAAAQTSGSVRAYGSNSHGLYVIAVDVPNAKIRVGTTPSPSGTACNVTDAADGCPTAVGDDYLYVTGDRNLKLNGFKDWIPYGGPTATAFNGVDRTSDPLNLAGCWFDGTSGQVLSAVLEDATSMVGETGGSLTHFLMPWKKFTELSKELGSKAQMVEVAVNAQVGYSGIKVVGADGDVICFPDKTCPSDTICGVNMETWELLSIGQAVHVWDEDGKVWLRDPDDSGMEIRFYSLANLLCKEPRSNINIRVTP